MTEQDTAKKPEPSKKQTHQEPEDFTPVSERFAGNNVRASWPFSLHTIRANMMHCSPDRREAMIAAFLWCIDDAHPVHKGEFASRIGYAENTVYKVYSGIYKSAAGETLDIPEKMAQDASNFVELERERYTGAAPGGFVMTPTARKIWTACDLARESQTPVVLTGRSHTGKTEALRRYASENNHGRTIYVRMKAACGLGGMVKRIGSRCGVSDKANTAALIDRIKNAVTPDMVLILDEMHQLQYTYRVQSFFACIEVIREIYDEVHCGMVLCGTELLLEKINQGARGEMEQILRRGVHRVHVGITRGDIAAIVSATGMTMPKASDSVTLHGIQEKPYALLQQLAKDHGLLAVSERLRYGAKIATRRGEPISWDTFVEAHLTISQMSVHETW
jgi:DNA transposition AAA+ family ATPase